MQFLGSLKRLEVLKAAVAVSKCLENGEKPEEDTLASTLLPNPDNARKLRNLLVGAMVSECVRRSMEVVTLTVQRVSEPCYKLSNGYIMIKCRFHKTCASKDAFFIFSPLDYLALQVYIKVYRPAIVPPEILNDREAPVFPCSNSPNSRYDDRFFHPYTASLSNVANYINFAYSFCKMAHPDPSIRISTRRLRQSVISANSLLKDPALMSSLAQQMCHTVGVQYRNYT